MNLQTHYRNTDLDLKSLHSLSTLCDEFSRSCCLLHHSKDESENHHAIIESNLVEDRTAADDIRAMLAILPTLTATAQEEWKRCYLREFNLGFDCGDTEAYHHTLPSDVIRAVANANCSLSVTLYPLDSKEKKPN